MFEKPGLDLMEMPEIDPDQETLEQKEEIIELNFSLEDFRILESTVQKYQEMREEHGTEITKKVWEFGNKLTKKYGGDEVRKVALHHAIMGSSGFDLDDPGIEKVDFEGEDSIAKFIEEL